jgi:hypothetical protein
MTRVWSLAAGLLACPRAVGACGATGGDAPSQRTDAAGAGDRARRVPSISLRRNKQNGEATHFPPLLWLGSAGDEQLAYQLGRNTGVDGRAAGVHSAFAPVVDGNNNPGHPINNIFSFGAGAAPLAPMAAAQIRGPQDHWMVAAAMSEPIRIGGGGAEH